MHTLNKELQQKLSIAEIKQILKDGNDRFVKNTTLNRDLLMQVKETSSGQFPHTVVLGCIDSRVTTEQVFDLGIGDSFNTRIAGNIVNDDILGSLEYACKVAGAKLILVLGHTRCGAVTSACQGVELGKITGLLSKIKGSVTKVKSMVDDISDNNSVNMVVEENVKNSISEIRKNSEIISEMEKNNEVEIIGGIYDVENGVVTFID